jgi:ligand-binding SRPBCC domain-containing protein
MTVRLEFASRVAAPAEQVWARISNMPGVNAELGPWLRMTYPASLSDLDSAPRELLGKLAFKSWVLLLGWLPIDRHYFRLDRLLPGEGFDERSWSWSQRVWVHRRRLAPTPGGTRITDELEFEPRVGPAAPFLRWLIDTIFRHRHRRLQRHFGALVG